jgi:hypothetical protein
MSTTALSHVVRERMAARAVTPVSRAVALETSVSEARWLLLPVFGLWVAFVAVGVIFG